MTETTKIISHLSDREAELAEVVEAAVELVDEARRVLDERVTQAAHAQADLEDVRRQLTAHRLAAA